MYAQRPTRERAQTSMRYMSTACLAVFSVLGVASCDDGSTTMIDSSLLPVTGALASASEGPTAQERARMADYLATRYSLSDITHSFQTAHGDDVDCVRASGQPGRRVTVGPGPSSPSVLPPSFRQHPVDSLALERLFGFGADPDVQGKIRRCPADTIPIKRITLDELTRFKSLDAVRRKSPAPQPVPSIAGNYHSAVGDVNDNHGVYADLIVKNPAVHPGVEEFSLSQLWSTRGSGADTETVEAGWIVYPNKFGSGPRFFIYSTSDNYVTNGGWNLELGRFTQNSGLPICLGCAVTVGSTMNLWLYKESDGGDWWVYLNGTWVGRWSRSLFDANGLQDTASRATWGGEIVNTDPGGQFTTTDMGAGVYPSSISTAHQTNMWWVTRNNLSSSWARMDLVFQTSPACYGLALDTAIHKIRFGGPGRNPPFCN